MRSLVPSWCHLRLELPLHVRSPPCTSSKVSIYVSCSTSRSLLFTACISLSKVSQIGYFRIVCIRFAVHNNCMMMFQTSPSISSSILITVSLKPGVHSSDLAPLYSRRAKKLGHASLTTVFRPGRLTFQPIPRENLESSVIRSQPITTSVVTDACLNTRWHHGAYISPKEDTGWLAWESRYVWIESWQCTWFSRRNERWTIATRFARDSSVGS